MTTENITKDAQSTPTLSVVKSELDFERAKIFTITLTESMFAARVEHPDIYIDTSTSKPLTDQGIRNRAQIMTTKLHENAAAKEGIGTQATLKKLGIKNTYQAIVAYLSGAPENTWKR